MSEKGKKEKVLDFFVQFKQLVQTHLLENDAAENPITLYDFIFYSTITETFEVYFNNENLYLASTLQGKSNNLYINQLKKKKQREYGQFDLYKLHLEVDEEEYGFPDAIEQTEKLDIEAIYRFSIPQTLDSSESNIDFNDKHIKAFFKNAPRQSIKVIKGYYFADKNNYYIFVFAIGFNRKLHENQNIALTNYLKVTDSGFFSLVQSFFWDKIV